MTSYSRGPKTSVWRDKCYSTLQPYGHIDQHVCEDSEVPLPAQPLNALITEVVRLFLFHVGFPLNELTVEKLIHG
jgi:hypothetical protein